MKSKFSFHFVAHLSCCFGFSMAISCAAPSSFLEGFYLNSTGSSLLMPYSSGTGTNLRSNIEFSTYNGGIVLYSGKDETVTSILDGGITLYGSPISLVLGSSTSNPDQASFNVWRSTTWGGSTPPLFQIDALSGISTFTGSNVVVNGGSLKVDGSFVLTTASASSILSGQGFLQPGTLGTALDGLTAPPTSATWTNAYVKRGNVGATSSGLLALGTGQATGFGSLALTNSSSATSLLTIAGGSGAMASGSRSIALGSSSKASAYESIAIGAYAEAGIAGQTTLNPQYSIAIGRSAHAHADNTIALGSYAESTALFAASLSGGKSRGKYSFSGMAGQADGDSSVALGGWASKLGVVQSPGPNNSLGHCSVAIGGVKNVPSGYGSYAFGLFNSPSSAASVSLGSAPVGGGTTDAWIETEPLFELGNTAVDVLNLVEPTSGRSNAIFTLKNGQTTLINKAWKTNVTANPAQTLVDPPATTLDSGGEALVVEGHTRFRGKVIIEQPQGDISMGNYQ